MQQRQFSLVVTCRNEMKSLPRWKKDLVSQTRFPDEIVIVDSESDDGTVDFIKEWAKVNPKIKLIEKKCKPAKGHNIGNVTAIHDIILSTDMGVKLSQNWCEELIRPFEIDPDVEVVCGNTCIDIESLATAVARAEYFIENGGHPRLGPGFVPGNRSVAYTKKVWSDLNGLPEDLTFYADDSVFGRQMIQADLNFAYAPKAMTYWARPGKLKQFNIEYFNYGKGDGEAFIKTFIAYRWHIEKLIPAGLVPLLTSIIQLLKPSVINGMMQALQKKDVEAFLLIPILTTQRWYHYAKGYNIGYKNGKILCHDCRKRLNRNNKGYSII